MPPQPLRTSVLHLAASLPVGDPTRRKLLAALKGAQSSLSVGDILYSDWGYNQTNIDFYQVIKATSAQVVIMKIEKKIVGGGRGTDSVMPVPGRFVSGAKALRRKVQDYTSSPSVSIHSSANAYLWDGRPKQQTSAGYGH